MFAAPYAQWMDHTAERNMRTIGEMAVTTLVHSNLPKNAWGHAILHAIDVINRTAESAELNKAAGFDANFSRLERWKGHALPGQLKGLYPFGCLAFKHVPIDVRTKLDQHATPLSILAWIPSPAHSCSVLSSICIFLCLLKLRLLRTCFRFERSNTENHLHRCCGGPRTTWPKETPALA